jgi:hypothetical protein
MLKDVAEVLEAIDFVSAAGHDEGEQVGTGLGADLVVAEVSVFSSSRVMFDLLLREVVPAAACASTYEKSGGLPADGRFAVRSTIEGWCRRDLEYTSCSQKQLDDMDYFDVYLRYWEHYQMSVVTSGWLSNPDLRIVAFGKPALQSIAQGYHHRYGSGLQASEFHVSDKARRLHPEWIERAQPSVDRVAATWNSAGICFPTDEVGACW